MGKYKTKFRRLKKQWETDESFHGGVLGIVSSETLRIINLGGFFMCQLQFIHELFVFMGVVVKCFSSTEVGIVVL
jgi:hypothetical protein